VSSTDNAAGAAHALAAAFGAWVAHALAQPAAAGATVFSSTLYEFADWAAGLQAASSIDPDTLRWSFVEVFRTAPRWREASPLAAALTVLTEHFPMFYSEVC
jgi:hypothetical protein